MELTDNRINKLQSSIYKIAPFWSLDNAVAVNPFFNLRDWTFEKTAKKLKYRGNIDLLMPLSFYLDLYYNGHIQQEDIAQSYVNVFKNSEFNCQKFFDEVNDLMEQRKKFPVFKLIVDFLEEKLKWNKLSEIFKNHITFWASSYFDKYQSQWSLRVVHTHNLFSDWLNYATVDLTPEIKGIKDFRKTLKQLPTNSEEALSFLIKQIKINEKIAEDYFHSLLLRMLGWSSYIAGLDWQANLYGGETNQLRAFLLVLLSWEYAVKQIYFDEHLEKEWENYLNYSEQEFEKINQDKYITYQIILQNAFDLSHQKNLILKFNTTDKTDTVHKKNISPKIPKAQLLFCIDVREEILRRKIEQLDDEIETYGIAGFFGIPLHYIPISHKTGRYQCPVLLKGSYKIKEHSDNENHFKKERIINSQFNKVWKIFKSGMISSFSNVTAMGLYSLPKLITDATGLTQPVKDPKKEELEKLLNGTTDIDISNISFQDKVNLAFNLLSSIGLVENFAPIIILFGHHSSSVNNPHAASLDCGACGGNSGLVNALVAVKILNDEEVRNLLREKNIIIPQKTVFLAGVHNTTSDEISIASLSNLTFDRDHLNGIIKKIEHALVETKKERIKRLVSSSVQSEDQVFHIIKRKSNNWAEVRPEWGLAGCDTFVIANRSKTKHINFEGRSFLHSYDHSIDKDGKILYNIFNGPVIVTNWINMQYYASTVDNFHLGAGNKTLHNVTGGIGVFEGRGGDLRIGLPLQSIFDGKNYQHQPLRLKIIIDAPKDFINNVLQQSPIIQSLLNNEWMYFYTLDANGKINEKYYKNFRWEKIN